MPENLILRELYENKIDIEIFKKIRDMTRKMAPRTSTKGTVNRTGMVSHFIEDRNIMIDEIEMRTNSDDSMGTHHEVIIDKIKESLNLQDIEDVQE